MKKMICGLQVAVACLISPAVMGGDGTWVNPLGGEWSNTANWSIGAVAQDGGHAAFEAAAGLVPVTNNVSGLSLSGLTYGRVNEGYG